MECLSPAEITAKAQEMVVKKSKIPLGKWIVLGMLAWIYIWLWAIFSITASTGFEGMPFGLKKMMAWIAFSLWLILVMIAWAELFTWNTMLLVGNADRKLTIRDTIKNWLSVYFTNFAGALLLVAIVFGAGWYGFGKWAIGLNILDIATHKVEYWFLQSFCLWILCNILVCLWVRLARAGKTVADKVAGILFPITAFVAAGFEHSVANMFYLPMAYVVKNFAPESFRVLIWKTANDFANITWWNIVNNLIPVTLWNIVWWWIFVWLAYRLVYKK